MFSSRLDVLSYAFKTELFVFHNKNMSFYSGALPPCPTLYANEGKMVTFQWLPILKFEYAHHKLWSNLKSNETRYGDGIEKNVLPF